MKSNRGLRFLLLAGLVSAFILWLLPVNSVTTDIFLLLASRTSIQPKVHSDAYASNTSDSLDVESSFLDTNITGTNPSLTDSEEVADLGGNPNNSTVNESFTTQPADITSPQDNIYSTLEPRTFISESSTGTDGYTQEFLSTRDITSSQNSTPREKPPLVTGLTTASMEDNQTICPRSTGMTEGEVLAIAIGAVFITILLSALFYQFSAFLKKKTAKRDSSVYIIENELHKFDMENNSDTRL